MRSSVGDWRNWDRSEAFPSLRSCGGLIDNAYDDIVQERRRLAASRLIGMNVEVPPDTDALSRELEAAHEPAGLP